MSKLWIGIDNGVSGSIGWIGSDQSLGHVTTPVFSSLNYQRSGKNINRVDVLELEELLAEEIPTKYTDRNLVLIERPMVNPKRFQASASALRALEATLIILEKLSLPYQYIDSKGWQKELLPSVKGAPQLKKASTDVGCRLFPSLRKKFRGDADGILIAEWGRRNDL